MHPKKMNYLVGKTINNWTILEARPNRLKGMVLAKCICGKEKIVRGRSITGGVSKCCGCIKSEYKRQHIEGNKYNHVAKTVYSLIRTRARNKSLPFDISYNEFYDMSQLNCFYCNKQPMNEQKRRGYIFKYNGLDRVDNLKGYTKDNIVVCCYDCNTKKGAITKEMIYKLYNWLEGKNEEEDENA